MNTWDKNRQDDKFKKKLMTVKSTMHKIFNNSPGNTASTVINKKANNTNTNKIHSTANNLKNKQINRIDNYNEKNNIPNGIIQDQNIYGNRIENFQRQQLLRRLLKEFGLGQYLRKFYELGYDDSNVSKLANLTIKDIDEFIERLRIFPGHRIKILGLIDRISSLFKINSQNSTRNNFRNSGYINTTANNPKRFHSTGQTRLKVTNMKQLASIYGINKNMKYNKKPKSVEPIKSKNRILNNFLNNEGFTFNYYLKDKNDLTEDEYNSIVNRGISNQSDNSEKKQKAEYINEEIDKMLNFYMTKLNEKIDDSFEDSFEEEINLKNFPTVNDFMNINNEYIKNKENVINNSYNISNEKTKQNTYNNLSKLDPDKLSFKLNQSKNMIQHSDIKNEISSKEKSAISENNHSKKESTLKFEEDSTIRNYNQINKNTEPDLEDQIYEEDFELHEQEKGKEKKKSINLSQSSIKDEENNFKKTNDNLKNDDIELDKNLHNQNLSNLEFGDSLEKLSQPSLKLNEDKRLNQDALSEKNICINNIEDYSEFIKNSNADNDKSLTKEKNGDGKNTNDSLDLSYVRLNKSCEVTYIRQNMDQFDIEYMCRCLGMALMKHLESSKEKSHIMELVDEKEEFSFFNSVFNKNMDFLLTFFNLENQIQQISNLDKIDIAEKSKNELKQEKILVGSEHIQKKENDKKELNNNPHKSISYLSHIKDPKEKNDDKDDTKGADSMNEYDKEYVLSNIKKEDIEKEINTIHEFFKNSAKNTKYKNVSETTKNIMTEELNSIHEVDSIEYCRDNKLFTGEMQDKQLKNNQYINLLRESVQNIFNQGENDLNDNLNVISENNNNGINEEELEDDIINYDDIDKNLIDAEIEDPVSQSNYENDCFDSEKDNEIKNENNKFSNYNFDDKNEKNDNSKNNEEYEKMPETPYNLDQGHNIDEDIKEKDEVFESGIMESNYIIDVENAEKLKNFILKTSDVYDDDYDYLSAKILHKRFVQIPDPQAIFEFAANIMILTKMEKEVIIISLIYMERFIFNTGVLINSRNWKRILFTSLIVASKIWDDDSFENNHFAQVFTHLKIGEINLLERTFLELINYKVYVKCSEYFKYFFIIKSIALKYNFNGFNLVPISVERMMKVQEYAYLAQKKFKKKYTCNNSAEF